MVHMDITDCCKINTFYHAKFSQKTEKYVQNEAVQNGYRLEEVKNQTEGAFIWVN